MYLKNLIIIVSTLMCASSEMTNIEEMYLNFFVQLDSVKKSIDILKVRQDAVSEKNSCDNCLLMNNKFVQVFENFGVVKKSFNDLNIRLDTLIDNFKVQKQFFANKIESLESQRIQDISEINRNYSNLLDELNTVKLSEKSFKEKYIDLEEKYLELMKDKETGSKSNNDLSLDMDIITSELPIILAFDKKPLFDVRVDKLPEFMKQHCHQDPKPTDCKTATKCTKKSGYYKINLPGNKEKQIMVFCDMEIDGGSWMHILRRIDGSENFDRLWSDYVNGFGKVEKEYWIGLENLNALTNNNGRQQLYAHLEDFNGNTSYAVYNNFVVEDADEMYKLKSLGNYSGTAVDGMSYLEGNKFSTRDNDNDESETDSCANMYEGGWWYKDCGYTKPTGLYFMKNTSEPVGVRWESMSSPKHYYKIINLMIRL